MNCGPLMETIVSGMLTCRITWMRKRGASSLAVIVSLTGIVISRLPKRSTKIVTMLCLFLDSGHFLKSTDTCC